MKKVKYMLYSLFLLFSCNRDKANDYVINTEIEINAKVKTTKAPINSNFNTNFPCGIYANKNGVWVAGTNLINNDPATVLGAAGHAVTFGNGPYYYPTNNSPITVYAFAPRATQITAAGAGKSPVVRHTITGQEDVMWASAIGRIDSKPVLHFDHKLTQLQFTFISGTSYPVSGSSVVSLLVRSQPTTVTMTVGTGACTFSGSANMQALSVANQTAGIPITSAGIDANSPVMTRPLSGTTAYRIDVVVKPASGANITYSNIPINITALAGSAHMITLTFNYVTVSCNVTVANWTIVNKGNVNV